MTSQELMSFWDKTIPARLRVACDNDVEIRSMDLYNCNQSYGYF